MNIELLVKHVFVSFLAAIVAGCTLNPLYVRPPLPTPQAYPRQECGTPIRQLGWQGFFKDPALKNLIALALENNRDLRSAILRMQEAKAMHQLQWGEQLPVHATLTAVRARIPGLCEHHRNPFNFSAYGAALSVISWELDFWGRLRSLKEADLEQFLATAETQVATRICLIGQVANAYLTEKELNELICLNKLTIQARQEGYRIMQLRFEQGAAPKFDFFQAEVLLQQAKADLMALERQRELNWNAMTLLVGVPICPDDLLLSHIEPCFIEHICSGLPSELLCNRPDVRSAEHKLLAARANIGAARAAFFPTISLTGSGGIASTELKSLWSPGKLFWAFIPNLSLPIFDLGKNRCFLAVSRIRQNLAVTEYERIIQVAFREVADALAERTWLKEQVLSQKKMLDAQTERTRLAWVRFQYSTGSFLEVLDAERERYSAEQAYVQTKRSLLVSGVNLYISLGGGY
jgi:outer membrane protein, multidrug efflux system